MLADIIPTKVECRIAISQVEVVDAVPTLPLLTSKQLRQHKAGRSDVRIKKLTAFFMRTQVLEATDRISLC